MTLSRPLVFERAAIRERIWDADHTLLTLDFDGTLASIAPRPEDARIPSATRETLRELSCSEDVTLAVLSGRSVDDVRQKVGLNVIYAGNHGLEIEGPGISFLHNGAQLLQAAVNACCRDLEQVLAGVPGILLERKGLTASVHYREAPRDLEPWLEAAVQIAARQHAPHLRIVPALKAWEIRPAVDWNKGSAARLLLGRIAASRPVLVCAGDDEADEDMFRAVPHAVSIKVGGSAPTRARYRASGPDELAEFLKLVVEWHKHPCLCGC